jgi:pyruvate formate lyase activating enzyme
MSAPTLSSPKPTLEFAAESRELDFIPIGGITPFTTIDFPGRLAAVLYTQGCVWRCRYCHNSHLWSVEKTVLSVSWEKIRDFLKARQDLLEGVVFCGGEPTLHAGLGDAMRLVKDLGFLVALHTTGMFPERLSAALPLCDWVGMDVKAPFEDYEKITGVKNSGIFPKESLKLLLNCGVDYEVRTTFHPSLLDSHDLERLGSELAGMGARHFVLQLFRPEGCQDARLAREHSNLITIPESSKNFLASLFDSFKIR